MRKVSTTKVPAGVFLLILLLGIAWGANAYNEAQRKKNPPKPKEYIGSVSGSTVKGNGNGLVLYFQNINGIDVGTQTSCPSGWTEAIDGYGPHYIGVLAYDFYTDGSGGTGGGFIVPGGPPPPPPTGTPTGTPPATPGGDNPDDPPTTPSGGGGGGGEEEPEIPSAPPITPGPDPNDTPEKALERYNKEQAAKGGGVSFWQSLVSEVYAAGYTNYFLTDVAFGSDDVCSLTSLHVVPVFQISQNFLEETTHMYSDACSIDPNTGIVTCNRCKVCRK